MTVREIAKLGGVSIGTVDRVLHGRGRVSPETAKRIEAIIEKHRFTPNPIARQLKRGKVYRFCALVPERNSDSGYWEQAIRGIQEMAEEISPFGVETEILEFDSNDFASFRRVTDRIVRKAPDGVVFAPVFRDMSGPFIGALHKKQIPYVFFDADLPDARPVCAIGQDSFKGGYLAGRLLHLFIGTVTGCMGVLYIPQSYHISRRKDGFLRYAAEQGIKTVVKEYSKPGGLLLSDREIEHFLQNQRGLQGVFASNADAHRVAEAAGDRRERKPIFIIGYDLVPGNHKLLKEGPGRRAGRL